MKIKHLWDWYPAEAITIFGNIYVKDKSRDNPEVLAHEMVHVRQQADHPVWFWVSYILLLPIFWNPFRTQWEAEAYATSMKMGVTLHQAAEWMSSWTYGKCCTYEKARAELLKYYGA